MSANEIIAIVSVAGVLILALALVISHHRAASRVEHKVVPVSDIQNLANAVGNHMVSSGNAINTAAKAIIDHVSVLHSQMNDKVEELDQKLAVLNLKIPPRIKPDAEAKTESPGQPEKVS